VTIDLTTGEEIAEWVSDHDESRLRMAVSGDVVIMRGYGDFVVWYDARTGEEMGKMAPDAS
jgi:hypothetical protein